MSLLKVGYFSISLIKKKITPLGFLYYLKRKKWILLITVSEIYVCEIIFCIKEMLLIWETTTYQCHVM